MNMSLAAFHRTARVLYARIVLNTTILITFRSSLYGTVVPYDIPVYRTTVLVHAISTQRIFNFKKSHSKTSFNNVEWGLQMNIRANVSGE